MTPGLSRKFLTAFFICFLAVLILPLSTFSASKDKLTDSKIILKKRIPAFKPTQISINPETQISHVVVKFNDNYEVRSGNNGLYSKHGLDIQKANEYLSPHFNNIRRLFNNKSVTFHDRKKEVLQGRTRQELADLNSYYFVNVKNVVEAEILINNLNDLSYIEIAYFEPMPEPAGDIDPPTPDFQPNQDYREAAPAGVDADYLNTLPGGDGTGVKIIDIEGGWQVTHEDLDKALNGLIAGEMINDPSWTNHGTAVIGELIAGDNGYGVTGICPGADIGMISIGTLSTAEALIIAADTLNPGDVILIELHAPGPHYDFQSRPDQLGYVCMEYWQANFDAIVYAWAQGVIVVEAAGNGAEDFDDFSIYTNLFDTTFRNSHAIIVGAGYPAASSSNLQKHGFSNFGERVNLQGYGSGVYTTGYGGLFDGNGDENQYYTGTFSGTSSASPIVTGAVTCLQGYYKAHNSGAILTSDQIRDALVVTGTFQLGNTSQHIGPRPNLQAAISVLSIPSSIYTNPLVLDTTLNEGETAVLDLWLINRSINSNYDFSIIDNDSLTKVVGDWLSVSPVTGTIIQSDSFLVQVTYDANEIISRTENYVGTLEISWGLSGGVLDSLITIYNYLQVPCFDTTYVAVKSSEPEGPVYNWMSAKDNGFILPIEVFYNEGATNPLDDGTAGPIVLGFDFEFYGQTYNSIYIGVNGGISFTDSDLNSGGFYSNYTIPGSPFSTFLPIFWNDLIIDIDFVENSGIYIHKKLDTAIIEWYRLANFNQFGDTTTNFEIILTKNGSILYQYKDVGISGLEAIALIGVSGLDCDNAPFFNSSDIPANEVGNNTAVKFRNTTGAWIISGDFNDDGFVGISDLTFLVDYMFGSGEAPVPIEMGDVDCSGEIGISDITFIVEYMFGGGDAPCSFWMSF